MVKIMELKLKNINIPKEYRDFIEYERKVAYLDSVGLYRDYTMEFIDGYLGWIRKQPEDVQKRIDDYIYNR